MNDDDPRETPPTDRSSPSRTPFGWGATVRAVGAGLVADIAATMVAGLLLVTVIGGRLVGEGASAEDLEQALLASGGYVLLSLLAGLACTVLGGYVAARVAGEREYYHALLTGIAVLVFGELMLAQTSAAYPLAYRLIGNILIIPAALYGGHLRKQARPV